MIEGFEPYGMEVVMENGSERVTILSGAFGYFRPTLLEIVYIDGWNVHEKLTKEQEDLPVVAFCTQVLDSEYKSYVSTGAQSMFGFAVLEGGMKVVFGQEGGGEAKIDFVNC